MPFQQLPLWIQLGAFMLALNAGMINVIGLITLLHQSVSHMTGNASMLAISIIQGDLSNIIFLILVILSYVLGSSYSGFILGNSHFQMGRRYGLPLSLMTAFIILSWYFIQDYPRYGLLWACAAMGIQNAMVSHYQGAIIRTTHLSGVLTDLGLALGYLFRGLHVEKKRIILHLLILFGFILGGIIATGVYPYLKLNTFLMPALLSFSLSCIYWFIYFRIHYLAK
ncbi:YoaK family protein [Acinetobacter sp. CFCC 10889]|uniref:YoaK family protein n=1 Tax=Acinetobacter sp. CFCC 10889 TaxID=1775557 RepID=UPI000DD077D6|nr:YoaK family protein [Acinetobacter sp. CFCC 10889]